MKDGYKFTPENKPYNPVTKDMTNENYTAAPITFTISGTTTVPGVRLKGLGMPGKTIVSGQAGTYSAEVNYGWSGTVTPEKTGYDFNPPSMPYDNVLSDQTNQSYSATLQKRTISGQILSQKGRPVADVYLMADDGGSATTDSNGEYTLTVDHGWLGKVTPTKEGYTFNPSYKPFTAVRTDQTRQNFAAIVQLFTITDSVIIGNTPIPGVTITAKDAEGTVDTATTNAKGEFSVKVPYGWTGEIIPTKEGLMFNPPSQSYTNVTSDMKEREPVLMRQPTPAQPTPAQPTPAQPTPAQPTPAQPKPEIPRPTEPSGIPTPTPGDEQAETTSAPPEGVQAPKTQVEQDIAKILAELNRLKRQQAGGTEPNVPATGSLTSGAGDVLITNSFIDNDLVTDVLPAIAAQAGISIIPEATVAGIVTADLVDVPLDTALEIVLAGTPFVVKKTPYYYLVCSGAIRENPMFPEISETRRLRMNYISAVAAVGLLATPFQDYVQAEVSPETGASTYTVVVTAPPKLASRIIEDLKQIDRPLSQVLLDARVVVMEKGDLLNLGVEWGWPTMRAGMFSSDHYGGGDPDLEFNGESPWGIQIGYTPDALFTNSLEMTLNLLAENSEATILTKPQVMAQDGKESKIEVTTEEYYFLTAPELAGSFYSRSELEKIESGTILTITPHLGDNNDITLNVAVEVSDSIPSGRGNEGLPIVTRRKAENNVTIKDGGTVALAGLTENRSRKTIRRAPGLSTLPLIGNLFKSNNDESASREIAVFITARLISNTGQTTTQFTQPSEIPAPIQPAGSDFRSRLRDSLSRR
jgi:hypothetical protein